MTAAEFAMLAGGKRIARGRWMARCPAHADRTPSLSIAEGKRQPIIFRCVSQGCDPKDILAAFEMTWETILGDRAVTPEMRRRMSDEVRLGVLETRWGALMLLKIQDPEARSYWEFWERKTYNAMEALRCNMGDTKAKRRKVLAAIEKYGMEAICQKFAMSTRGQEIASRWGV